MKRVLLDTDIFIDHFRNYKPATSLIEQLSGDGVEIALSVLTVAEVMSGKECRDKEVRSDIESFFAPVEKIHVDWVISIKAGEFRRRYGVPLVDAIIAATAYNANVPVYSRNKKDFSKIKEIKLVVPY